METPVVTAMSNLTTPELWEHYHRRADARIENALVENYLPLVASVMGRLAMTWPDHIDRDDLYSAGLVGLLQALRNYDPTCGTAFETYARVRVRGAMLDELRRMDWVPRTIHEKARKLKAATAQLEQTLGRAPTEAQMARSLGVSVTEYHELLEEIRPAAFVCLDSVVSSEDGDGIAAYEVVADTTADGPLEQASQRELKNIILEQLKELPEIQRKVLALYYVEDMHLREIAEGFGLTESRICQIHSQAILSIRAYMQRFESGMVQRHAAVRA